MIALVEQGFSPADTGSAERLSAADVHAERLKALLHLDCE
jgi:hypothetical protein